MSETTVTCPLCEGRGEIQAFYAGGGEAGTPEERTAARRAQARERLDATIERLRAEGSTPLHPDNP